MRFLTEGSKQRLRKPNLGLLCTNIQVLKRPLIACTRLLIEWLCGLDATPKDEYHEATVAFKTLAALRYVSWSEIQAYTNYLVFFLAQARLLRKLCFRLPPNGLCQNLQLLRDKRTEMLAQLYAPKHVGSSLHKVSRQLGLHHDVPCDFGIVPRQCTCRHGMPVSEALSKFVGSLHGAKGVEGFDAEPCG